MYDNSDLPLTDLERQILELRSKDRDEEIVGDTGPLIKSSDVGSVARLTACVSAAQLEIDGGRPAYLQRKVSRIYHLLQVPKRYRGSSCTCPPVPMDCSLLPNEWYEVLHIHVGLLTRARQAASQSSVLDFLPTVYWTTVFGLKGVLGLWHGIFVSSPTRNRGEKQLLSCRPLLF